MSARGDRLAQLLEENIRLRQQVDQLRAEAGVSQTDRLKLAIIERSPFTLWAADRHFKVRLWSCACETVYGLSEVEALGEDYHELFVDDAEKEQSKLDCVDIIDNDRYLRNFLAYDHSDDGQTRYMLTNCYRVWDPASKEFLQAEIALDVGDLDLRKNEHRALRELGIQRLADKEKAIAERDAAIEQLREELFRRLSCTFSEAASAITRRIDEKEQWQRKILSEAGSKSLAAGVGVEIRRLQSEKAMLAAKNADLTRRLFEAGDTAGMSLVAREINEYAGDVEA